MNSDAHVPRMTIVAPETGLSANALLSPAERESGYDDCDLIGVPIKYESIVLRVGRIEKPL